MTQDEVTRDRAMEGRVGRTLADAGLDSADVVLVLAAHRLAMELRIDRLEDPHHPDFLHPGRTVLILVLDCGFRDPTGLAAAALLDSEWPRLRTDDRRIRDALGDDVAEWVRSVPLPGADLAEALLTAQPPVRLVALAERLDHCRHAKFWSDRAAQAQIHEQVEAIYGPVAERTDPALARRFKHWSWAFGRARGRESGGAAGAP